MIKSLHARSHQFARAQQQVDYLEREGALPTFSEKLDNLKSLPLRPNQLEILQLNVGYMCNQTCKHCHVDAGPDRKESMSRVVMSSCLDVAQRERIPTLDITGGAPEMNSDFRWLVSEGKRRGIREIIVRSNLTILSANPKYHDLPDFFREHSVRICSSLPFYNQTKTDRQRGDGVFVKSIEALQQLNAVGYGAKDSGLILDLVYNPVGAFLPGEQLQLERDFKERLMSDYGITFNNLFTITNMPISRFLDFLIESGNYDDYMEKLVTMFNPATLDGLMCRNTLSVDWNGYLYDCDFNQMLGLKVSCHESTHIDQFNRTLLQSRSVVLGQHCYACTAGSGSSCQGTVA